MQCPKCHNQVVENIPVCIHCGAEIGICIKCKKNSYFININLPQKLEYISAYILIGLSFNYSRVKFRQCAICKNSVQICINCGRIFKGMNKCPYCQYSHFVGFSSIIQYLKLKRGGSNER